MIQLSIITINYNNKSGLEKTLASISILKSKKVELIVVDGNSSDGSADTIKKYKDSIDSLIIEPDEGIYDAMNKGVKKAKGRYIIFINSSDEWISPELPKVLENKNSDVIYGDTRIFYENEYVRSAIAGPIEDLWKSLPFVHQSVMVKNELLQNTPFNLKYKYCSDYELFCKLHQKGANFEKISIEISLIEAGGLSDVERDKATEEVFLISQKFFKLSESQKKYFQSEIKKGRRVQRIKKLIPKSLLKLALKMKYRE